MNSKYIFAVQLTSLDDIARQYQVDPQVIEKVLDKFFSSKKDEIKERIDGKRYLRVIRHEDVVILQLARKRGLGFNVLKDPWYFVFKGGEHGEG